MKIAPHTNITSCRRDTKESAILAGSIIRQTQPRAKLDCCWAYAEQIVFTAVILHTTETGAVETVAALASYIKARTADELSSEIAHSPNKAARKMWVVYEHCDTRLATTMLTGISEQLESLHRFTAEQPPPRDSQSSPLWLLLCVTQLPNRIAQAVWLARTMPEILGRRRRDFQLGSSKRIAA